MAYGALRDAQLLGGACEADVPGSGLERLERIQLWQASRHRSKSIEKLKKGREATI
jgi:hypothetical protein